MNNSNIMCEITDNKTIICIENANTFFISDPYWSRPNKSFEPLPFLRNFECLLFVALGYERNKKYIVEKLPLGRKQSGKRRVS